VIAPGDIAPRQDSSRELYVAVLSNSIHLAANTGRVITCPFIPGRIPDDAMSMVVAINQPEGTLLPELVQWLPSAALGEPIGTVGTAALGGATSIVAALIS
jgi:hypothetical protein